MSPQERVQMTSNISVSMAVAFRDKFDFSSPSHFDDLADISWKAAQALVAKREKELALVPVEVVDLRPGVATETQDEVVT
jgi:hypothetical protein